MRPPKFKPRLLVTGATGLIGSRFARLAASRFQLVSLGRTAPNIPQVMHAPVDLSDPDAVGRAVGAHSEAIACVHLAAFTDVNAAHAQSEDAQGECYKINVRGTENLARACADAGIHLIHISTDFVFSGTAGVYTEETPPDPIEWYGKTKLAAEKRVREHEKWTILRVAYPYGPAPGPKPDLVQRFYRRLAEGGKLTLFDDQVITPTYIDDIAQGIMAVARAQPAGEIYHLVGSTSLTPFDLGLKIARTFNFDQSRVNASSLEEYVKTDSRPRQKRLQLSNEKWRGFATRNGLHPPLSIDQGLTLVKKKQPINPDREKSHCFE